MTGAVIGTGHMGKTYIRILRNLTDKLVICGRNAQTGMALAQEYGCQFYRDHKEMFVKEKPDFVAICVPTDLHYLMVKDALEQGIPVLCEKPFTLTANDALELYRLAKSKDVLLMIAHCLRFSNAYAYLKDCITKQPFGKLCSLHMFRNTPRPLWSSDNWFADTARSGGVIQDLHIHDTDMAVHLLGVPKAVHTAGDTSCCTTTFSYPNNLAVTATASWRNAPCFPAHSGFDAVFENACLVYEKNQLALYHQGQAIYPLRDPAFVSAFESSDMIENELRYFCNCLVQHIPPSLCSPAETVKTMLTCFTQSTSLTTGHFETIKIPRDI